MFRAGSDLSGSGSSQRRTASSTPFSKRAVSRCDLRSRVSRRALVEVKMGRGPLLHGRGDEWEHDELGRRRPALYVGLGVVLGRGEHLLPEPRDLFVGHDLEVVVAVAPLAFPNAAAFGRLVDALVEVDLAFCAVCFYLERHFRCSTSVRPHVLQDRGVWVLPPGPRRRRPACA